MLPSPRTECASVDTTIGTPASIASLISGPDRSSRSGSPFVSSATPVSERDLERPLEIESVRRTVIDDPPLRMAQRTHGRMSHRLRDLARQLVALLPLPGVQAELHPLELREHVVGKIERAVGPYIHLGASQHAEGRKLLVDRCDLLCLPPQSVRVEAGNDAHVRRVVADRDVLVAEVARSRRHLQDRRLPVRPRRVHVEVAANVVARQQRRRLAAERLLAQLRWTPGNPELRVQGLLVRRRRQLAQARDVCLRSGPDHELGAEARRLCDHELDGHAFDRHADRAPFAALEHRHDRRERLERVEHRPGPSRRGHHREVERDVGPAARIARNLALDSGSDLFEHFARPIQRHPFRRLRLPFALECGEQALFRLRSDPRDRRQPPFPRRHPELLGAGDAERLSDLDHPLRPDAEEATKPDELGLHLAFELVELGDATGLDELAQARRDPRADPSQLLDAPCGNELGDRRLRLADRLRRSPIRARRVEARAGEIEECRETLQLLGDRRVVEGVRHGLVSLAP